MDEPPLPRLWERGLHYLVMASPLPSPIGQGEMLQEVAGWGAGDVVVPLLLALMVLLSAFLSASETAFSSLNRIRVKRMAEGGSKRAALVLALVEDYDRLLSTILVGNNIVNLTAASVATVYFVRHFPNTGAMISTVVITVAILIFGEVTPKSLAKESPERFAGFSVYILRGLLTILTPVNYLFGLWRRFLGLVVKTSPEDRTITEQELLSIVEEAELDGVIDEEDKQLINSAIEFNDLQAHDILTPRMKIIGIPQDASADEMAALFVESGYSRIPIFSGDIDNIVGIVHLRDFLDYAVKKSMEKLDTVATPAVFIAPSMKINDLFKKLQREKVHMVIVADEFGGTAGLVTMEDILEELVGDIWDESDEIVEEISELGDNKYRVLCSAEADSLFEHFGIDEKTEASTVGGWIMETLGKIPEEGDSFEYRNLVVTVHKVDQRKALECIVSVKTEELPDKSDWGKEIAAP